MTAPHDPARQHAYIALAAPDAVSAAPAAVDVERIVQWALAPGRQGGIPWRDEAALSFDRGCTAKPRRAARGSWALVFAGTVKTAPRRVVLEAVPDGDAGRVLAAIRALPGLGASLVIRHGRQRTRPGWTERNERVVPHWTAPGRPLIRCADGRNRERPYCVLGVEISQVVTEAAICRYRAWWCGMAELRGELAGRLERWRITGFAAPERPWENSA